MTQNSWKVDGQKVSINHQAIVHWEDEKFFTIQLKGKSFYGELLEEQLENRKIKVKINHRIFDITKEGSLDQLIEDLGLNKVKIKKLNQLKSPMPGRVVNISVQIGDEVEVGTPLLTLEAMKMENVLKAEGIGKVKSIEIQSNDVVDKGAVLITFE
ncbi:MAG: acetyl-CoA carboxylase biotin carboxyl carrier protein subunit [Flavobacteriia bacterium]|nr:acetyl-CoA carboxylase biotin carboxyl carrier protein subunit [Flavobacteriia bacterium]